MGRRPCREALGESDGSCSGVGNRPVTSHRFSSGPSYPAGQRQRRSLPAGVVRPLVQIEAAAVDRARRESSPRSSPASVGRMSAVSTASDCSNGTHALAPEQDRHPPVIIPGAAVGGDIAPAGVGDRSHARLQEDDEVARALGVEARLGALRAGSSVSGGPEGRGAAASSALVNTAATWRWRGRPRPPREAPAPAARRSACGRYTCRRTRRRRRAPAPRQPQPRARATWPSLPALSAGSTRAASAAAWSRWRSGMSWPPWSAVSITR